MRIRMFVDESAILHAAAILAAAEYAKGRTRSRPAMLLLKNLEEMAKAGIIDPSFAPEKGSGKDHSQSR